MIHLEILWTGNILVLQFGKSNINLRILDKGYGFVYGGVLETENVQRGAVMKKYCIRISRMIEVENLNEVEVFKKIDFLTKEELGHYLITKDKELYQIDDKTYGRIPHNQIHDVCKVL